uniref:Uncharacterized protein n=1 Tax=Aegilops tauschii TaxID=37682 RepID=R7VYN1_AEGTA
MAFLLAGKAKGGELVVTLAFQILEDGGVGLYSQPATKTAALPELPQRGGEPGPLAPLLLHVLHGVAPAQGRRPGPPPLPWGLLDIVTGPSASSLRATRSWTSELSPRVLLVEVPRCLGVETAGKIPPPSPFSYGTP